MSRASSALLIAVFAAAPVFLLPASAKLPPLNDEAKAKAAETAAKTAWTDKVGAYQLCRSMERTADHYRKTAQTSGKPVAPAVETPACTDPGAYVPLAAASAPPLEAAGAHSPATMAVSPPSSKATAAEIQGPAKK